MNLIDAKEKRLGRKKRNQQATYKHPYQPRNKKPRVAGNQFF
jgi:hypothetical protein